ncbi:hypothetical protein TUM4636_02140 [Shewanella glacialipiscicola]|uniref:Uncharacterized protein n=1 Tax=Shewanella glacialipiscicola TaxID=614069 RepID=A0ABQ6J946_9GAMM|nr:hypothetical protein TUM4636_02140 [Shewanella glacialipiscicola]GMA84262.1 hypothetical protein GCM10025855_37950 [Shewanella glacialipiscicola]
MPVLNPVNYCASYEIGYPKSNAQTEVTISAAISFESRFRIIAKRKDMPVLSFCQTLDSENKSNVPWLIGTT